MKKLFSSMLCIMAFASMLTAKTIYVTPTGSNASTGGPSGLSWSEAVGLTRSISIANVSGDVVYVQGGIYNLTKILPSSAGAFGPTAGVSFYGSFAGTETSPLERATSDVDGNGNVDPWEFTNQSIINFTLTNSAAGFTTSNASAVATYFNGFKLTGTNTASTFSTTNPATSASWATATMRVSKNIRFENNIISDWTVTGNITGITNGTGPTLIPSPFFEVYSSSANTLVNNCLFENNIVSYTASFAADTPFQPFISISNATGGTVGVGNVMSNCVVRNNKVTVDYRTSTFPIAPDSTASNIRGLIIAIKGPIVDYPTSLQNTIIQNNEVEFMPQTDIKACYGATVYTYNSANPIVDYILNCTIANNKTTKCSSAGLKIGMDLAAPHDKPNHVIMNNVMYNNFNDGTINNILANYPILETSTTTLANNICNGGATNVSNASFLQANNLFDLSNDNGNTTKGANFIRPTTAIGYVTDGSAATSNWRIKSNSYLKWKGTPSITSTDKAGYTYADIPSVGAYEYNPLFSALQSIKGNGTFEVFPNPAQDIININTTANASISIYTLTGAIMTTVNSENAGVQTINVSNLTKGNYIVTLKSNGQILHQKLIKQ